MSKSPSRRFPVTVTQLPVTRCEICHRTVAYRPGSLSEVLTEHYRRAHPEALGLPSPVASSCPHYPAGTVTGVDRLRTTLREPVLMPAAPVGDRLGQRRVFPAGLGWFAAAFTRPGRVVAAIPAGIAAARSGAAR
jgi:hypothetical protein